MALTLFNIEESELLGALPNDVESVESRASIVSEKRYIVDDVEIFPPAMIFAGAYEGKSFCKRLCIQNVGKKTALVRIGHPTANAFTIRTIPRFQKLSPGLKIIRTVTYTFHRAFAVSDASINITINNSSVDYHLKVVLNQAKIVLEPEEVEFGRIDAVSSMVTRTVAVKNVGTKSCSFSIDLGLNELELIVEPIRGIIEASETVLLKLEVMGFSEGPFEKEFWIKSVPPKRVQVKGEFITPKIIATYPKSYADFSMVLFPRLYVGQRATKTLMVKNISSTDIMFCVMAVDVIDQQYLLYDQARLLYPALECFTLSPLEGRLGSHQTTVIEVVFEPKRSFENNCAVCFVQVIRIDCKDVNESIVLKGEEEYEIVLSSEYNRSSLSTTATTRIEEEVEQTMIDGEDHNIVTEEKISLYDSFRVCLYGDIEEAHIIVRPSAICMNEVNIKQCYLREVLIENTSSSLSITIKYIKMTNVNMEPDVFFLKPKESREVLLSIVPSVGGPFNGRTYLELTAYRDIFERKDRVVLGRSELRVSFTAQLAKTTPKPKFNMGINPTITNEVGFMTHDVRFNTEVKKPKTAVLCQTSEMFSQFDDALVAFPNDTRRSLRPWTTKTPCLTIFKKIPRGVVTHDEYGWSPSVFNMKLANRKNINDYAKFNRERLAKLERRKLWMSKSDAFELRRNELFQTFPCEVAEDMLKKMTKLEVKAFVPLSPTQLQKVKISPRYIRLQRMAPVSTVENTFTIHNGNEFPVFVYVTTPKSGITFPQGYYKVIEQQESKNVVFNCFAGVVGRYINMIQIVLNFNHLYTISLMVEVVPKLVTIGESEIIFEPTGPMTKFLELKNTLNSAVTFSWEMAFSRYELHPMCGSIPQKKTITCSLTYVPLPDTPDCTELNLTSEGGGTQFIQVSRKKKQPTVELHPKDLKFGDIPLNTTVSRVLILKNLMSYSVCFVVVDSTPLAGVELDPNEGIIRPMGEIMLRVMITMNCVREFKSRIDFVFEDCLNVHATLTGNVVYPDVEIVPDIVFNRQILPYAYRRNPFSVRNNSCCECYVKFGLDEYEEYTITDDADRTKPSIHNDNLKLMPGEVKQLFFHSNLLNVTADVFYLPIIINDMLGPPVLNDVSTVSPAQYLNSENCSSKNLPAKLPLMKITSITTTSPSITFSAMDLVFYIKHRDCKCVRYFTVTNVSTSCVELCIRIETLTNDFVIEYHEGTCPNLLAMSIVCSLGPEEFTTFAVTFVPTVPGCFTSKLPIYVRDYFDGCLFNNLNFKAIFPETTITTKLKIYYLEPTPLGITSNLRVGLDLQNHREDCEMMYQLPQSTDITIELDEKCTIRTYWGLNISYVGSEMGKSESDVTLNCSCGASHTITVITATDNCLLTHHAFIELNNTYYGDNLKHPAMAFTGWGQSSTGTHRDEKALSAIYRDNFMNYATSFMSKLQIGPLDAPESCNTNHYPYFPNLSHTSVYAEDLKACLKTVERWVYTQGFYKTKYLTIPESIALIPIVKAKAKEKGRSKLPKAVVEPHLVQFLVNLAGPRIRKQIITSKPEKDTANDIALHLFITYQNIIKFLVTEGAVMPHVEPEYLLLYEHYIIICTFFPDNIRQEKQYLRDKFLRLSKRCYMDLILQSIKLFVLFRLEMFSPIDMPELNLNSRSKASLRDRQLPHCDIQKANCTVYSEPEHILLYWLQYNYDITKYSIWEPERYGDDVYDIPMKDIKSFTNSFEDSLVFAAVTVAYCPYVSSAFSDMIIAPNSSEELYHNACRLIRTWDLLNLSYRVQPRDLVVPNSVNMLLLTLYLYEVLPNFYPRRSLAMEAKLTTTVTSSISIQNPTDTPIVYTVLFFNNEHGCFSTEAKVMKVAARKNGTLKVRYQARKVTSQRTILVLSGETGGQKYAKSLAIDVCGTTLIDNPTKVVDVEAEFYQIYMMHIQLFTPYGVPDDYEILYKISVPEQGEEGEDEDDQLYSWKEYVQTKVPKRMFTKSHTLSIKNVEEGCFFEPIICCSMTTQRTYTMYLIGKYGDWCIRINTIPKITKKQHEVINVSLPRGFSQQSCACKNSKDFPPLCPRTIRIDVPSRNNLLLKSTREMFIACTDEQVLAFWKKFLPIRTVLNVLKLLFQTDKSVSKLRDYQEMFQKTVTYEVTREGNSPFRCMDHLTIEDYTSDKTVELYIHANPEFEPGSGENYIRLATESGIHVRYYKLNFYEC